MNGFLQDLRYAALTLRKNPGFTATAVVTLAIGIGANTAIFSVIDTVLLRQLPYRDPDKVVTVWQTDTRIGGVRGDASPANFVDWRAQSQSFDVMAAVEPYSFDYYGGTEPEVLDAALVTEGFFDAIGVQPSLGRTFGPSDYIRGQHRVVVISYGLFQQRFGGNRDLVGRTISLDNEPYTLVGVLPPEYELRLFEYEDRDVWAPKIFGPNELTSAQARVADYWNVVARLKSSVTMQQAQAEMQSIAERLSKEYPNTNATTGIIIVPLHEHLFGHLRPALLVLLGAVGVVLLIATANVANLLLAKGAQRRRELSIRTAMGASRGRLVRQLLTESLLLTCLASAAGLFIANAALNAILIVAPGDIPYLNQARLDWRVLGFAAVLAGVTATLFGMAPSAHLSNLNLRSTLAEGGRTGTSGIGRQRLRAGLVITEVALAITLMVSAGLLVRSFVTLLNVDPGFRKENLLALQVFAWDRNTTPEKRAAFFRETLARLEAMPGVTAAGAATAPPFFLKSDMAINLDITIDGRGKDQQPFSVFLNTVTPTYFQAMGIPVRRGRAFSEQDLRNSPQVAIINDTMARQFFPNENPIGKRVISRFGGSREIVGVVGDVRHGGLDRAARPEVFVPHAQSATGSMTYVVRTASDPGPMMQRVKEEIWAIDRLQTFYATGVMEDLIDTSLVDRRFTLTLLGVFAGIALFLATVGLYGVISLLTTQRTNEIGVRVALGASARDIWGLIVGQALKLVVAGVAIGLLGAFVVTRSLRTLLFGVTPTDPSTFISVTVLLMIVALAAASVPARRVARVDPLVALRYE